MSTRIEDYGLIGDNHTAALVSIDGSIDWLCLPRFDSPSCFSAILADESHGRWSIRANGEILSTERAYEGQSLILVTEVVTDTGRMRVTDFMAPRKEHPTVVRLVECTEGEISVHTELTLRFDYSTNIPWVRRTEQGLHAIAGPDAVVLHSEVPLEGHHLLSRADFNLEAGQSEGFVLRYHESHKPPPKPTDPRAALERTRSYWSEWSDHLEVEESPWKQQVIRSLITLKALIYQPTGGIVAAPTTSLPEDIGGVRNWDYRFCWVRDATLTLDAMVASGCLKEAENWIHWLMRSAAGSPEALQIMYGLGGERRLDEYELDLPGYEGSKPVHVGNAASGQFQLDVYGELMDAISRARHHGLDPNPDVWRMQLEIMKFVTDHYSDPDDGLWEVRGPRRHFTHSKVMAWVAFDRAVEAVEDYGFDGPVDEWRRTRDSLKEEICQKAFNQEKRAFTQYYGGDELDAAVLMIPLVGFLPPDDPRMVSTVEAIQSELNNDGFILRYQNSSGVDGLPGSEGAFLPCTFWLVDCLALMGRVDEAEKILRTLHDLCSPLGLISEEYDPRYSRLVGNFPQAFTHVGLVNSVANVVEAKKRKDQTPTA